MQDGLAKPERDASGRSKAFTLVEMLVGIAIVCVLAVLLSSAFKGVQKSAQATVCAGNLKQIGAAMGLYLGENNGQYPAVYDKLDPVQSNSIWYHKLLNGKYLDSEDVLFCKLSKNTPPNKASAIYWGGVSYGMNLTLSTDYNISEDTISPARAGGVAAPAATIFAVDSGMADGPSYQTYFVYPSKPPGTSDSAAWPRHNGQCNVLWVDGHVSGVKAPRPDPGSIYDKDALGSWGVNPNHWKRN